MYFSEPEGQVELHPSDYKHYSHFCVRSLLFCCFIQYSFIAVFLAPFG